MRSLEFLLRYGETLHQIRQPLASESKGKRPMLVTNSMTGRGQGALEISRAEYHWTQPPKSVLKINVDGAFIQHPGQAVIGVIVRDEEG